MSADNDPAYDILRDYIQKSYGNFQKQVLATTEINRGLAEMEAENARKEADNKLREARQLKRAERMARIKLEREIRRKK